MQIFDVPLQLLNASRRLEKQWLEFLGSNGKSGCKSTDQLSVEDAIL